MSFQKCCKHLMVTKRLFHETHYDVLKVKKNCTQKDIKKAFITLSKEHHPDMQNNKDTHEQYVKILDAYKVLGQPGKRAAYDLGLPTETSSIHPGTYAQYHPPEEVRRAWNDPSFYANRKTTNHRRDISRSQMYYLFGGFVALSIAIYSFTLWKFLYDNNKKTNRWNANAKKLAEVRMNAIDKGNDAQIEHLVNMASRKVD